MNTYHLEQLDTIILIKDHLSILAPQERHNLLEMIKNYLAFRKRVDEFLNAHFSEICTRNCYQNQLSACCSKEGIVTFFADVVINILSSDIDEIDKLLTILKRPNMGYKCVYLSNSGCRWRIKPIVCEMFLCQRAINSVFSKNPHLKEDWEILEQQRNLYTWPDRPVLFDALESFFLNAGYKSPLMYLNTSPGLLHVKQKAGIYSKYSK
jgi:hypothetical protein